MTLVSDVTRRLRREARDKLRIVQRAGRHVGGFDAAEVEAVSAAELARRVLKKFGAKAPDDDDGCIEALDYFLDGAEAAGRVGMDSVGMFGRNRRQTSAFDCDHPSGDDFVSRYRRGGER